MSQAAATIEIVVAVVRDSAGRVLVVRKHGSDTFIQPGGKPDPGEAPLAALARELREELGVVLDAHTAVPLGPFEAWAVHEAGHRVRAQAWAVTVAGTPRAQAEIAELAWVPLRPPHGRRLAALSADHILPAAARAVAAGWTSQPAQPGHRMSSLPPPLPHLVPSSRPRRDGLPGFVLPTVRSVLVVSAVSALGFFALALICIPLADARWLAVLLQTPELAWLPGWVHGLIDHAVATNLLLGAGCLLGIVAAWGFLRRWRWALWLFIVLLVVTALLNFVLTWMVDDLFRQLLGFLPDAAESADAARLRADVNLQRISLGGTLLVSSVVFLGLQGWLAVRLCAADVRAWFKG